MDTDIIGGFPFADPNCKGCGKTLLLENAWMTDGCPCNHVLGVNSMNETRWRLLMQLQQRQSSGDGALEFLKRCNGHRIVSSGDLTTLQIAEAQARKLWYVEPGGGFGWALLPWELTTDKDRQRERRYFTPPQNPPKNERTGNIVG
jgi:hypothetical protein